MSKITVTTIAGQTSGSDANKVKIESGDTLEVVSNATVGGTLGVTGVSTFSGNIGKVSSGLSPEIDIHVKTASGNPEVRVESTGANYATYGLKNSSRVYSTQIRTDQSNAYVVRDETGGANRLLIDTSGRITEPSQPSFLAKGANGAYITTSPIPFPTVSGGGVNMAAHNIGNHYNTSNYTFTAPVAGRYFFHVHLGIVRGATSSAQMYPTLAVNGNGVAYTYAKIEVAPTANNYLNCSITQVLSLSANDAVKVVFAQSGTGSYYNGAAESSFMGYLLG